MPTTKTKKPASNGKWKSKSGVSGKTQKTTIKHSNGTSKSKQPLGKSATIQKTTSATLRKEENNKIAAVLLEKKKKKPNTVVEPVYLGYPDSQVNQDDSTVDAFQSYIGGYPIWFDETQTPEQQIINCGGCGDPMYLLVQLYAPLDHRPHERVIYVWGCNRRQCMRKPHSIRALRAVQMNQSYTQQLAATNKNKRGKTTQSAAKLPASVLGNTTTTNSTTNSMGFGMSTTNTGVFSLGNLWNNNEGADLFNTITKPSVEVDATETLLEQFNNMNLTIKQDIKHKRLDTNHEWSTDLPAFKHYWLDIETESLEQLSLEKLKEKYARYMDLQAMEELASANSPDQDNNEWESEQYEKSWKPNGFDKAFKKFTEIVQENPEQCIRYQWKGQPLFYTHQDDVASLLHESSSLPSCPVCGASRIFELQLMPSLLSALATSTYRRSNDQRHHHKQTTVVDSLDMGMEWGTIFVFTCENDCFSADTLTDCSSIEDGAVRFYEELVLLQHEI